MLFEVNRSCPPSPIEERNTRTGSATTKNFASRSPRAAIGCWGYGPPSFWGCSANFAEAYGKHVVEAQLKPGGDKNVIDKVAADLGAKDQTITAARVKFELEHFAAQARRQLLQE